MAEEFTVRTSTYKGHPVLEIHNGKGMVVSFGKRKAEAIVAVAPDIAGWLSDLEASAAEKEESKR